MVDNLLSEGKCGHLNVETIDGINRTLHHVTGRFGEANNRELYGIKFLPLVHPDSRIAQLVQHMKEARTHRHTLEI